MEDFIGEISYVGRAYIQLNRCIDCLPNKVRRESLNAKHRSVDRRLCYCPIIGYLTPFNCFR